MSPGWHPATVTDSESGIKTSYYYDLTDRLAMYTEKGSAISREKQLKKWRREKKNQLIETLNPQWCDLSLNWD